MKLSDINILNLISKKDEILKNKINILKDFLSEIDFKINDY